MWVCGLCIKKHGYELDGKHRACREGYCSSCNLMVKDLSKVKVK